jgi:GH15 family glucan-1,4-alpha-glucosidase
LIRLGYTDEANAFMRWIDQRCTEPDFDGRFQVMYGIDGRHDLPETELDHFSGYENSRPVRIGNAAHDQLQLDIYGALLDAVYLSNKYGEPISHDSWMSLTRTLNWLTENWKSPDEGIWEVRGGRRQFLHSRVMCWVAFDRALRLAWRRSLPCPFERWTKVRDEIHQSIFNAFWDKDRGAFMQYAGGNTLDAAALMMPMLKIVSPRDPRWLSTLQAIGEDLAMDSLVRRYRTEDADFDGLPGDEGCFLPCTFWYVECLALAGETAKARLYFEKALGYANHLGLFSEELGLSGEHLGNYPQALTHLSLISAAFALDNALAGDSARSHHAPRSATA